jgi:MFS family permease
VGSGILSGIVGRKKVILCSSCLIIVGWTLIGFSSGTFELILIGRVIQGTAMLPTVSQIYLAEISDSKRRLVTLDLTQREAI